MRSVISVQTFLKFISIQYNKIYKAYEQYCNESGLVDFGEIILRTLELLKANNEVKSYYHSLFRSILIDEFQDTNTIQYELIKIMTSKETSVFAVGDDDQSIYGWRGAKVENIDKFQKDYKGTKVFRLEQNFLSETKMFCLGQKYFVWDKKYFVRDKKYFVRDKKYFVRDKNNFVQADGQGIRLSI